jgi:hypothetical protein
LVENRARSWHQTFLSCGDLSAREIVSRALNVKNVARLSCRSTYLNSISNNIDEVEHKVSALKQWIGIRALLAMLSFACYVAVPYGLTKGAPCVHDVACPHVPATRSAFVAEPEWQTAC